LTVSFDGFQDSVTRQTNDFIEMAQQLGLTQEVVDGEKSQRCWQAIADPTVTPERLVYRLTVPRGALMQTISTVLDGRKIGPAPAICADVPMGTLWLVAPAEQAAIELFPRLIALTQQQRGHAVILAAPAPLKEAADVWGPTAPAHALMRKIKQEFDPTGLFSPGRFVGNI